MKKLGNISKTFKQNFVFPPTKKHKTPFSFISKRYYVSNLLDEIGLRGTQSDTYKFVNKLKKEAVYDNIIF